VTTATENFEHRNTSNKKLDRQMWNAFGIFLLLGFGFVIFIPPLGYVLFFLAFILFFMAIINSFIQASKPSKQAS